MEEGKIVSEITEKDYETGMKLINNNCQYLGDNLVYIRAKTIDEVKFDEWKIVRDSGLKVTIQ